MFGLWLMVGWRMGYPQLRFYLIRAGRLRDFRPACGSAAPTDRVCLVWPHASASRRRAKYKFANANTENTCAAFFLIPR